MNRPTASGAPLRLGILGAGVAGAALCRAAEAHPEVVVVAVADPSEAARAAIDPAGALVHHRDAAALCADADVDAVYIATPSWLHAEHGLLAAAAGKHVVVEKPMAVDLDEATRLVEAADAHGVVLLVGHAHSYEPAIGAMRRIVASGELGQLRSVVAVNYTDWLFRPRTPDELDPARGGGVVLRQGSHHADAVRFLAGGLARSVRAEVGAWDPTRPHVGAYQALVRFADDVVATLVYSGHDHFPGAALTYGIGERGAEIAGDAGEARRRLAATADETAQRTTAGDRRQDELMRPGTHHAFFGLFVVSCARGDLRVAPDGVTVYGDEGTRSVPVPTSPDGRGALLDELVAAVRGHRAPSHDGRWGRANLELCLAITASAAAHAEIDLHHQVALVEPDQGPAA